MGKVAIPLLMLLVLIPGCGGDKAKAVNSEKDIPKHVEPAPK
jgi:hypothetical protein